MKKVIFGALCTIFACSLYTMRTIDPDLQFLDQVIFTGTIQFPKNSSRIPHIRIYYGGNKPIPEIDNDTKKLMYHISAHKNNATFYLLICEEIEEHRHQELQNLVLYLKKKPLAAYKLYKLDLVYTQAKNGSKEREWRIQQMRLGIDGRIPDYAIIVRYNPDFVEGLEAVSSVELPSIKLKQNLVELAGSQDALDMHAAHLLMESIDIDLIHATIKPDTKKHYEKTIVAMITH